jgi:hypothetical protein
VGETRITYRVLVGNLNGTGHLEELRVGKRILLKCILKGGGRQDGDWIRVAENKGFHVADNARNFLVSVAIISSVKILFHAVIYT